MALMLRGEELLGKIKELPGSSKEELVRARGVKFAGTSSGAGWCRLRWEACEHEAEGVLPFYA